MTPTLVFEVMTDLPVLEARAGDFIVCEPGATGEEHDILLVRGLPRGRLGKLMGADLDGVIRLTDPPASSVPASQLLLRLLQPALPGRS